MLSINCKKIASNLLPRIIRKFNLFLTIKLLLFLMGRYTKLSITIKSIMRSLGKSYVCLRKTIALSVRSLSYLKRVSLRPMDLSAIMGRIFLKIRAFCRRISSPKQRIMDSLYASVLSTTKSTSSFYIRIPGNCTITSKPLLPFTAYILPPILTQCS